MITFNFDFIKNWFSKKPVVETPHRPMPIPEQPTVPVVVHVEGEISTFEEAVDFIAASINPQRFESPFFHLETGMGIRNGLRLWQKDSALYHHMLDRFGLCHADDTGMLITNAARAKVEDRTYDIEEDLTTIRDHWARYGYDPATMQRVSSSSVPLYPTSDGGWTTERPQS